MMRAGGVGMGEITGLNFSQMTIIMILILKQIIIIQGLIRAVSPQVRGFKAR
jgi:hypothetical protein